MGVARAIYVGDLNHRVGIYHVEPDAVTTTGETHKKQTFIGNIQAKREDKGGTESDEEAKVYYVASRNYYIRFVDLIWKKGENMFIHDEDGDYYIFGMELIGKKEFLKLKTTKRE